jgi:hypothetical protein
VLAIEIIGIALLALALLKAERELRKNLRDIDRIQKRQGPPFDREHDDVWAELEKHALIRRTR